MRLRLGRVLAALLGILGASLWFALLLISFRFHAIGMSISMYAIVSLGVLTWGIVQFVRRRATLRLTFCISFSASALIFLAGFIMLVIAALRAFT